MTFLFSLSKNWLSSQMSVNQNVTPVNEDRVVLFVVPASLVVIVV